MTENETEAETGVVSKIRVVVKGTVNKDVEYTDGMTHEQVLKEAGVDLSSLEYGTIAIDGEIVVNKGDLKKRVTKEQQVVSVAPAASNG